MAISTALRASARSAYRELLRASALTFAGDVTIRNAFTTKMRNDVMPSLSLESPLFEEKVKLAQEIATVLRRNIVQGHQVGDLNSPNGEARWKLRITEHTELGSNDTIKSPPPMESSRSARKRQASLKGGVDSHTPDINVPRNYSQLKVAHRQRTIPELREKDIEEAFVRGSGPGGQSINKTENNVQLLHKPTGIRVACQETRSLSLNRRLARRRLLEKLDQLYNPGLSKQDLLQAKQAERERRHRKKMKKKALTRIVPAPDASQLDDD